MDPIRKLRIRVNQDEARQLGLSSATVAQMINAAVSGITSTQVRDSIYLIDVVVRAQADERMSLETIRTLKIPLPNGRSVPLSELASVEYAQDLPLIWRRDRLPTLTVQAEPRDGVLAATAVAGLAEKVSELKRQLPVGYKIVEGGSVEESAKGQSSVLAVFPIVVVLMVDGPDVPDAEFQPPVPGLQRRPPGRHWCRPCAVGHAKPDGVRRDAGHRRAGRHDHPKLGHHG